MSGFEIRADLVRMKERKKGKWRAGTSFCPLSWDGTRGARAAVDRYSAERLCLCVRVTHMETHDTTARFLPVRDSQVLLRNTETSRSQNSAGWD